MVVFSILRVPMTEWSIGADAQVCLQSSEAEDERLTADSNSSMPSLITSRLRSDHLRTTHMESRRRT
jgi:hypothetical protein